MNPDAVVIVGGARTAMAEYAGTPGYGLLAGLSAIELGAHAARGALQRANVIPEQVSQVCFGNVLQSSVDALSVSYTHLPGLRRARSIAV